MKKETVAQKARKKLLEASLPKKKSRGLFGGTLGVGVSKINKHRKKLEESLRY
jgi:hypothetical protein